jgi:two-component system response regulator AtoC
MDRMSTASTKILIVDDEETIRESLGGWLEKDGYTVGAAPDGPTALERLAREPWSIVLLDLKMPGMDGLQVLERTRSLQPPPIVVIMTACPTVETAVSAITRGAYDYLVKPFDLQELSLMIRKIVRQNELARENDTLRKALKQNYQFRDLVSKNPAMQAAFDLARTAARSTSPVLILGESGTGKELLARAIHAESPRHHGPFVAVSCAALTETLLESELFGHERGAFTGAAARRCGHFEAAHGGTLETHQFTRVGGSEVITVDVRTVAATSRDLPKAVAEGRFSDDLFHRLNVIALRLPPLRERREDIPLLVEHLLERMAAEHGRRVDGVSRDAMAILMAHDFPGNVRELRNMVERATVCGAGPILQVTDFGLDLLHPPADLSSASLESVERRHIASVLEQTGGNVSQTARILDIDRVTLYSKIRKFGLRERSPVR